MAGSITTAYDSVKTSSTEVTSPFQEHCLPLFLSHEGFAWNFFVPQLAMG